MSQPTNAEIMKAIADLSERMELRFAAVEETLRQHGQRFEDIDKRFDGVDKRFDGVDKRIDGIVIRLDGMDKRQDDQNAILAALIPVKVAAVGR